MLKINPDTRWSVVTHKLTMAPNAMVCLSPCSTKQILNIVTLCHPVIKTTRSGSLFKALDIICFCFVKLHVKLHTLSRSQFHEMSAVITGTSGSFT